MPLFSNKSSLVSGKQAQQVYRFVLRVKGIDAALIQSVTTPKYKISTTDYQMLEYKFKYPTTAEWTGPITFDVLQILDEDLITSTLGFFMSKLYNSDYYASPMGLGTGEKDVFLPNALYKARDSISTFVNNGPNNGYARKSGEGSVLDLSKQKLTNALGNVEIITLDEEGNKFDCWRLNGAFITGITPVDLTYNSETLSTVKVELSYDWASYGFRGVYAEEGSIMRILSI